MSKKAKFAFFTGIFMLTIFLFLFLFFIGKTEAQVVYNNNYASTPSEIKNQIPLTIEKDANWQVEWYETYSGLTHREYVIAIQNQKLTNEEFNLSVLFDNLNFDTSKISNINLLEWKNLPTEVTDYSTICNPYNTTVYEPSNNTYSFPYYNNCSTFSIGSHIEYKLTWKKTNELITQQQTSKIKRNNYAEILIDKYGSKQKDDTENGVKYLKLSFDVPITKFPDGSWGSQGRVAFIEENSQQEYHPWWNSSWQYRKPVYFNITETTTVYNITRLANGTVGINTQSLVSAIKMQSECDDIRFADANDIELPFDWDTKPTDANYGCNTPNTLMWVRLPNITSSGFTAYMYYGNTGATAGNNSASTFKDMVLALTFGEGAGTVVNDKTSHNNTGIISGSAYAWNSGGACKIGKCLNLTDYTAYATINTSASLNVGTKFSFFAWVYERGTAGYNSAFFSKASEGSAGHFWFISAENPTGWRLNPAWHEGVTYRDHWSNSKIVSESWGGYGTSYNSTDLFIYLNGTKDKNYTDNTGNLNNNIDALIGGQVSLLSLRFSGKVDTFFLWNYSLSDAEIKQYYTEIGNSNIGAEEPYDTIPPNTTQPIITPATPKSVEDLRCNATLTDNKATTLIAYWKWYKNNQLNLSGITTGIQNGTESLITTLLEGNTTKAEQWICEVKPFDGNNYGNPINSTNVTILNTAPTHIQPKLQATSYLNTTSDNLTCYNQSTSDADSNKVTNIYNWFKNSQPLTVLNMPFENSAKDYSGKGNDGTIYGATWTEGKVGRALQFDGKDDYVEIADSDSLDFNTKKTWQIWFKRTATGAETLFNKGNATQSNYKLEFLSNNKLKFSYSLAPGMADYSWQVNTKNGFDQGAYNQTYYNTTYNAIMLNSNYYSGDYKSKIYNDSGKTLSFNTISFSADVPTIAELSPEIGTVVLYHLNELNGTIIDYSGEGNNGTNYGATYNATGKLNTALSFDGVGDYLQVPVLFSGDQDPITFEAWIKINSLSEGATLYGEFENAGDTRNYFSITTDGRLAFDQYTPTGGSAQSNANLVTIGSWIHVAITKENDVVRFYKNGNQFGSDASHTETFTGGSPQFAGIGARFYSNNWQHNRLNGTIDEVAIYNKSLSASEIQEHYNKGIGAITNLSLSVRSCTQSDCSDKGTTWDISNIISSPYSISSLTDNKYFQFKSEFSTNNTQYSPKLYNATLSYSAQVTDTETNLTSSPITDTNWHLAVITFDNDIATNNFKLYLDNSLATQKTEHTLPSYKDNNLAIAKYFNGTIDEFKLYQDALTPQQIAAHYNQEYNKIVAEETTAGEVYMCQVTPNDGEENGTTLNSTSLAILVNITFDVRSGETNLSLTNFNIYCNNSFTALGVNSPYSAGFSPGSYECILTKLNFFNETINFIADNDKIINVVMSLVGALTTEEHTWLEWLYNCWKDGDCRKLLENINQTTTQIWQQVTKTNRDVVAQENFINSTLSNTSNITINYTINIPFKQGYNNGELLPLRLFFWFTDVNKTKCYNQDKTADSNRAESPYCFPLIAETLGPNNGSVTFTVDLRPNLPTGSYNITRAIEIDPVLEGVRRWINYGQEDIGQVMVEEGNEEPEISLDKKGETFSPKTGLLTGSVIQDVKNLLGGNQIVTIVGIIAITFLIVVIIICSTIYKIKKIR